MSGWRSGSWPNPRLHAEPSAPPKEYQTSQGDDIELTNRQMTQLFDVSLNTLRHYERLGLLRPRRIGPLRLYGPTDRVRMQMIQYGKKLGFTLSEIRDAINKSLPRKT